MKRLQQYDFEVKYRAGKVDGNADALSRHPCAEEACTYCSKVKVKEGIPIFYIKLCEEKFVGRIIFEGVESEYWKKIQLEDPSIRAVYCSKEVDKRPLRQEITSGNSTTKEYWLQWEISLKIREGGLSRKWESSNLCSMIFQTIIPRKIVFRVLRLIVLPLVGISVSIGL